MIGSDATRSHATRFDATRSDVAGGSSGRPVDGKPVEERPVIGLTAYHEQARWGVWDRPCVLLPDGYVHAIAAAGGVPVLLPPQPGLVEAVLPRLDGLVLCGGPDIDPQRYGSTPLATTGAPRTDRDAAELGLFATAAEARLPVLGVCRGLQLINVARGGTLVQHLPDRVGNDAHAPALATHGRHPVRVMADSLLARALGGTGTDVPTYHHQAVDVLGSGLRVSATAPDGTVEGIEDPSLPFCVGVQWHPELGDDPALFEALVAAARAGFVGTDASRPAR